MPTTPTRLRRVLAALAAVPVVLGAAACGGSSGASANSGASRGGAEELRLGYFANATHAAGLVGLQKGFIADALGGTKLPSQVFNAGPDEVEALFAGGLDAAYIGPS